MGNPAAVAPAFKERAQFQAWRPLLGAAARPASPPARAQGRELVAWAGLLPGAGRPAGPGSCVSTSWDGKNACARAALPACRPQSQGKPASPLAGARPELASLAATVSTARRAVKLILFPDLPLAASPAQVPRLPAGGSIYRPEKDGACTADGVLCWNAPRRLMSVGA